MPWHAVRHYESTTQCMPAFCQTMALFALTPLSRLLLSALLIRRGPWCGFSKHCVRFDGWCVAEVNPIPCITAPGAECNNRHWTGSRQVMLISIECGALLV